MLMVQIGPLLLDTSILLITGIVVAIGLVLIIIAAFIIEWWESSYGSGRQSHYGGPHVSPTPIVPQPNFQFSQNAMDSGILYHGTPRVENAQDILNHGFLIGRGNSCGSGLYLGDLQTAMTYTKGTGVIIKVRLDAPVSQVADYNTVVNSPDFMNWSSGYGNGNHGNNISNYTVQILKKRFLRVNNNFYVALANKTNPDERVVFEGITILGVLDAQGNPI